MGCYGDNACEHRKVGSSVNPTVELYMMATQLRSKSDCLRGFRTPVAYDEIG